MFDDGSLRRAGIHGQKHKCHRPQVLDVRFIDLDLVRHDVSVKDVVLAEVVVDLRRLYFQLVQSRRPRSAKRVMCEEGVIVVDVDFGYGCLGDLVEDVRTRAAETDDGYALMAASLRAAADELGAPIGLVLEGGYDVAALSRSVVKTLDVLGDAHTPPAPVIQEHSLSVNARARISEFWPGLA